jgi:hypothetical protein
MSRCPGLDAETLQAYIQFEEDVRRHRADPVTLQLTLSEAWFLFANLQLALTHPLNIGPAGAAARLIGKQIEPLITLTPAMRTVAERGWDVTCCDTPYRFGEPGAGDAARDGAPGDAAGRQSRPGRRLYRRGCRDDPAGLYAVAADRPRAGRPRRTAGAGEGRRGKVSRK